jgi:tripartite-type tricarboxylate transporter receptor subunit TctC
MNRPPRGILLGLVLALCPAALYGQGFNGPIRILVGGAPGGPSDSTIRLLVPRLSAALGQTIVIDNRPGTVGQGGVEQLKSGAPDGRTLMLGNSGTHSIIPSLYRNVRYDPIKDFAPISLINTTGLVLVAHAQSPVTSFSDLITRARRDPGKLDIGVAGPTGEIAVEAMMAAAKIRLQNVRYKGSSPAEIAVLSNEVGLALLTPVATVTHLGAGKLRALGVTSSTRLPLLPSVPTLAESGLEGYSFQFWNGLFAPAGTLGPVIRLLHREVVRAVDAPEIRERFTALGFVTIAGSPDELAATIKREVASHRKLAAETGIGNRE